MATKYDGMRPAQIRPEARKAAQAVLDSRWNKRLPVDPIVLARDLGAEVYTAQLGEDVYGMITGTPAEAAIYLDVDQSPVKMRFTCAHELGHYVERSDREVASEKEFADIDKRSDRDHGKPIEVFANEFAGALLMPESEIRRLHAQGVGNVELGKIFNVSMDAVKMRKFHLGLQ